jgi:hypothetical protein
MNHEALTATLQSHRNQLNGLGIKSLKLFGSAARGEAREDSDVDLLVEFDHPVGLFHFARARRELAAILGRRVDLVTPAGLRPEIRERIMKEAVHAA